MAWYGSYSMAAAFLVKVVSNMKSYANEVINADCHDDCDD